MKKIINENLINRAVEILSRESTPLKIILFGSYARGDANYDSDVDFLVIEKRIKELTASILKAKAILVIIVSNEVGGGIVPGDPLSRRFRDLVGLTNQIIALRADEVIMMQAGIPIKIK